MRQGEVDLSKGLKRGLRRFAESARNSMWLLECHNWAPAEDGLEAHETLTSLGASGIAWGGEGQYTPTSVTRDITIRVTDYVNESEQEGVSIYLDNVLQGTTDSDGEIEIDTVTVGGHELKMIKTGFVDSDVDTIFNDYILVI